MVLAVIPARYASQRFPGKPLADLVGKSMIQRVYEGVSGASSIDRVVVATDDQRIADHVIEFGGEVMLTRDDHPSGTDRVAEVAARFPEARLVVNVQGDEPFITGDQIDGVIAPFVDPDVAIATLAIRITDEHSLLSPNVVKVVRNETGGALYFSRHAIPFLRDVPIGQWLQSGKHLQHLGLYAYRNSALAQITKLPKGDLENEESLEQLRWLAAGYRIHVGITETPAFGIDTPADLDEARRRIENRS